MKLFVDEGGVQGTFSFKRLTRKEFINSVLTVLGGSAIFVLPGVGVAGKVYQSGKVLTVQQIINLILKKIPGAPFKDTVDTIKSGDATQKITGIATTMFATDEVIEQAAKLGINFIIAHEPTFYNHKDETSWLKDDQVYKYKRDLLKKHGIVVWRFHDYLHALKPDPVTIGILKKIGWEKYYNEDQPNLVVLPGEPLESIIALLKDRLSIPSVKVIGDKTQLCSRILIAPGAAGGTRQIAAIKKEKPDVFICGELNEWETSEYVRDLRHMGLKTALLVVGHVVSEEPGMEWLAHWLKPLIRGVEITHIPSNDAFAAQ